MESLIRQLRINISESMYKRLTKVCGDEENPRSVSGVVRDALEVYLSGYKNIQNISSISELKNLSNPQYPEGNGIVSMEDLLNIKNWLNSQPILPMSYKDHERLADEQLKSDMAAQYTPRMVNGVLVNKELQKALENPGLVILQPKAEVDPDIKQAFSISSIKAGPGASQKLRSLGIDPIDVIRAKRARSRGSVYNTDLEKYFDLV